VKRILILATLTALLASACASASTEVVIPTEDKPDFIFITATPTAEVDTTPTQEPLPFRDMSSLTPTVTAILPTDTPPPATATTVVVAATVVIQVAQPTAAVVLPVAAPTQAPILEVPVVPTSPPPTVIVIAPIADTSSAEQAVIDLSNVYRAQYGLPPLNRDEGIMAIARARSADMVARGYFGHNDPFTGASIARPQILALGFGRAGENYYVSGRTLEEMVSQAVTWFMGDPPHRANILNTAYTSIGVGIAWNGQMWILTQDFGG
jgi:uncharacterized protein YkwD